MRLVVDISASFLLYHVRDWFVKPSFEAGEGALSVEPDIVFSKVECPKPRLLSAKGFWDCVEGSSVKLSTDLRDDIGRMADVGRLLGLEVFGGGNGFSLSTITTSGEARLRI